MDDSLIPFIVIGGMVILVAIIICFVYLYEKKRSEALKEAAIKSGFSYAGKTDKDFLASLPDFNLFKSGHSRKVSNLMRGNKNGISWTIFDYRYTIGGGKNSHTYNQTAALAGTSVSLPKFCLCPENFFHKIGDIFGYKDIDFDNYPVFSKEYLLRGDNENEIRKLFTPELISYLENQKKRITIETKDSNLIYYILSRRIKPEELVIFLEEACRLAGFFNREEF